MNNTVPTIGGPSISLQGVNPNGLFNPVIQTSEIPKVSCVADASRYPGRAGTQDVLLDQNDPEIAYFRLIDANGFVQVDRRRCLPEPEPTQEQINDARYLSRDEFRSFMDEFKSFREEMSQNVRVLTSAADTTVQPTDARYTCTNKSGGEYNKGNRGSKVTISNDKVSG